MLILNEKLDTILKQCKNGKSLDCRAIASALPNEGGKMSHLNEFLMRAHGYGAEIRAGICDILEGKKTPRCEMSDPQTDPVSSFLRDMSVTPLLTPEEEIELAKTIEITEEYLRIALLHLNVMLRETVEILNNAYAMDLLSGTVVDAPSRQLSKDEIKNRMPENLETIMALMERMDNEEDNSGTKEKIITLVEELGMKTSRLLDLWKKNRKNLKENKRYSSGAAFGNARGKNCQEDLETQLKNKITRREREWYRARNCMVDANLRLVTHVAKTIGNAKVPLADLIQYGSMGLIRAVEKYEYERGYKFSTYATWWIRQYIIRAIHGSGAIRLPECANARGRLLAEAAETFLQQNGRKPSNYELSDATKIKPEDVQSIFAASRAPVSLQTPTGEKRDGRLSDAIPDKAASYSDPPSTAGSDELVEKIHSILEESLHPRDRTIILLRFGLINCNPLTLEDLGKFFGVTRERIRQIEQRAIHRLRKIAPTTPLVEFANHQDGVHDANLHGTHEIPPGLLTAEEHIVVLLTKCLPERHAYSVDDVVNALNTGCERPTDPERIKEIARSAYEKLECLDKMEA